MPNRLPFTSGLLACALLLCVPISLQAKDKSEYRVQQWLQLGPVGHPLPVFFDGEQEELELAKLFGEEPFSGDWPRPREGRALTWFDGSRVRWEQRSTDKKGRLKLTPLDGREPLPSVVLAAVYFTLDRWAEIEIEIPGTHNRCAWVDGVLVLECGGEEDDVEDSVDLVPGTHLLVVQTAWDPRSKEDWYVGAELTAEDDSTVEITFNVEGARDLGIEDVLDAPLISSLAMSPDGDEFATTTERVIPGTDEKETSIEIRNTGDGSISAAWTHESASAVSWSPSDGRYLTWLGSGSEEDETSLFLLDRTRRRSRPLLSGVDGYLWSPNGRVIAFWTTEEADKDERGVKRVETIMDRWATHRDKQYLHLISVPDGVVRRLTAGEMSTEAQAFSPNGERLLFTRTVEDVSRRPYSRTELWEVELETLAATKLRDFRWFNAASYAPDGERLLIHTQPDEFGAAGVDVPEGTIPNSYDGQLFLWDPQGEEVDPITRGFDPTVLEARWSKFDGNIYMVVQDGEFHRLARYDVEARSFAALDSSVDHVTHFSLAEKKNRAVAVGSSPWKPQGLAVVDQGSGAARSLPHPADEWYDGVRRGSVETWGFTSSGGKKIQGRVYLPPDFDPQARYPAIVYYYGGTSPTSREFGGRYPKEWWSARGYVVYVLQPSGATGYGQDFSAAHVNDWGKTSSDEIIEGTRKFLETHPFVDASRVGCIGASYGGFVTMLLTTKTDVFAAAVAHAGISSISSYWGEGYWGYSYSSAATAESFPWNRPDIYVDQSPLFRADQARVPLLLTHGRSDTNVPVGESDAFFVALKLLGKQVEYVQIEGQDHWIVDHDKRRLWSQTILAWFDRWLKDQPEWWNDLYE